MPHDSLIIVADLPALGPGESPSSLVSDHDVIVQVTLNRPDARNALNQQLLDEARAALAVVADRLNAGDPIRAVILTGAGKAFCAGMDLRAVRSEPHRMGDLLLTISRLLREIRRLPVPTMAQVQGAAVGGGCGLMTVCDFAFTHPEAKVGYPEVDLGVCPAVVAPWLIRKIGAGSARRLLLAGGTLTGAEAHAVGLATHLVPADLLADEVLTFARRLARGGPEAIRVTKAWLNELDGSLEDEVLDRAAELSARIVQGAEAQERLAAAFAGKG